MRRNKGKAPPRYEAAFKEGAVKLVVDGGRHGREVAEELGVHYDTLKNWLKAAGVNPKAQNRDNREAARVKEQDAQIRELKRQLAEKQEVIEVLKKSVGIFSKP
jgi:transposase